MNNLKKEIKCIIRNLHSHFIDYQNAELSFSRLAEIISKEISDHSREIAVDIDEFDLYTFHGFICVMDRHSDYKIYYRYEDNLYIGIEGKMLKGRKIGKVFSPISKIIKIELSLD